jgi:predicted ATPase
VSETNRLLRGFGIAGFRSFGREMQFIGPLAKINLIVGANNCGKSNVLRFAADHLAAISQKIAQVQQSTIPAVDLPIGEGSSFRLALAVPNDDQYSFDLAKSLLRDQHAGRINECAAAIQSLVRKTLVNHSDGISWVVVDPSSVTRDNFGLDPDFLANLCQVDRYGNHSNGMTARQWKLLFEATTSMTGGDIRHWVGRVVSWLVQKNLPTFQCATVPAVREIDSSEQELSGSGKGLISQLAKLQNPILSHLSERKKFRAIENFVREVTQTEDANVEVPHDRETIHVQMGGRTLPLSHLGTGIHQVVMLAAAATLREDHLVCLEEPEMNLHPALQKQLMKYLQEHTKNQYLISTHSAHLLDTADAAIFRIGLTKGWSRISLAKNATDHFNICADLGYHASDLLQANSVVWVEGPSDRIYLLAWLSQLAPELIEGIHFSVMFYGGRLLAGVTADLSTSEEFVNLRKLNRSFAVIMDSDRSSVSAPLNDAKNRIISELASHRGLTWVTAGREIENYSSKSVWNQALQRVHPRASSAWNGGRYSKPFGKTLSPDKVRLAREVCASGKFDMTRLGLEESLTDLVALIRDSNPPRLPPRK